MILTPKSVGLKAAPESATLLQRKPMAQWGVLLVFCATAVFILFRLGFKTRRSPKQTIILVLALLSHSVLAVYGDAPAADKVMTAAKEKASIEHKAIFLHFGASWCGPCKVLDAFLDRPDIKPVFEKYFVPVKLVAPGYEHDKAPENPGADTLLRQIGGPDGIPYFAFLDAKGKMIVNCRLNRHNIGFPAGDPDGTDYFLEMMKKAAPKMLDSDVKIIETALRTFSKPAI
jgi:thiol-disulfide isomerase/thioredoxin